MWVPGCRWHFDLCQGLEGLAGVSGVLLAVTGVDSRTCRWIPEFRALLIKLAAYPHFGLTAFAWFVVGWG